MRRPLSEIIKEMACSVLADPDRVPSGEAAHACLFFAHAAWDRATRGNARGPDYRPVLRQFEASNPSLWSERKAADSETLVASLIAYKRTHFPDDYRQFIVCGMRDDNVRVEWIDPEARTPWSSRSRRLVRITR